MIDNNIVAKGLSSSALIKMNKILKVTKHHTHSHAFTRSSKIAHGT